MQNTMQQVPSIAASVILRSREAFIRSVIWAFIGLLYGMLFIFFAELADVCDLPVDPYFFSGVLAGAIGALIYSSMRLAVLLAAVISPVCMLYLVLSDAVVQPAELLLVVAPVGAIIGALYGYFSTSSRVYRADAKILTGFSAGFIVSLGYLVLSGQAADLPVGVLIGVMCPLTGFLYVLFVPTFIRFRDNLLPPMGDGALAGTGVAVFLTLCFYMMISSINPGTGDAVPHLIRQLDTLLPQAMVGGLIGGGIAGLISGLLLTHWQDL